MRGAMVRGAWRGSADNMASLSLALLLPLIESQSRTDPAICESMVSVLLGFLGDCTPYSFKASFLVELCVVV